jgi:hypothetical protein
VSHNADYPCAVIPLDITAPKMCHLDEWHFAEYCFAHAFDNHH